MKKKKIIATVLSLAMLFPTFHTAYADVDFEGWNEETKDDAYTIYNVTDWVEFQDKLIFSGGITSSVKADVPTSLRLLYEKKIKDALEASHGGIYGTTIYTELFLAMLDALNDGILPPSDDPFKILEYVNPNLTDMTEERSINLFITRFFAAERAHDGIDPIPSIYDNTNALMSVVQGALMGGDYVRSNPEYSLDNANAWYSQHTYPKTFPEFASIVSGKYRTVNAGGAFIGKAETAFLKAVAEDAASQDMHGCIKGQCEKWVEEVYYAHGCPVNRVCCAHSAGLQFVQGKSMDNIPVGACVYSGRSYSRTTCGGCGRDAGHVGIYIGNGQIAHNTGRISICTLEAWIEDYPFMGWGYHNNYIGS